MGIPERMQNSNRKINCITTTRIMNSSQLINQTSGNVEYYTPQDIIEAARSTMLSIDLDPASSKIANERVRASQFYDSIQDGLKQKWFGHVWMNHPFGRGLNKLWIDKLIHEYDSGNVKQACCITYACTSEKWFKPLLRESQCFLDGRTNYIMPSGEVKKGVTKGSVVTYFGPDFDRFYENFKRLGTIKIYV